MRNGEKLQGVICRTFRSWNSAKCTFSKFHNSHSAK